jgi:oligopeptide/dipeptide ABC transporter ATP-binding protein
MPRQLFEVRDLRVAVYDSERAIHGEPGPTSETGEELGDGWVEVLPGVTYGVDEGEVLAMIGESASGKSLALMGAFGLLAPGARVIGGSVRYRDHIFKPGGSPGDPSKERSRKERKQARLAGTVVADYTDAEWARVVGTEVGFMFQNPVGSWTPDHVIGAQAGEALAAHSDLTPEEIEARVYDALGEVRLPKSPRLFGAYRHQLSRGMAQRAMLAAALTKAPYLMIADEPLNGLDPSVAAAIMELVRDMQHRRGMAMVVVTHDLAAVASLADRVAVLYGGEIVEDAPVNDLYHHPRHPYSDGLVGSIPGVTPGRLRHIPGEAPRLVDIDHARCVFADRCAHVSNICRSDAPRMRTVGASEVACHHADELTLLGIGD